MSCTLTLTMLISLATSVSPQPSAAPFVAGYDRFFHEADQQQELGGTLLLGELSCVACHASEDATRLPKRGPRLDGVGLRVQREWMQRFIAAPRVAKPGTTMPGMLHLGLYKAGRLGAGHGYGVVRHEQPHLYVSRHLRK